MTVGFARLSDVGQPGETATVYVRGTNTPASLWTDENGTTAAVNPTAVDSSGNVSFFADDGLYDVAVHGGRILAVTTPRSGTSGRAIYLSAQGLDNTGATAVDAAFTAVLNSLTTGDVLVIDRGTWKFTTGNLSLGGKKITLRFDGGIFNCTFLGVPLFAVGAGDKITVSGQGAIHGAGKLVATPNTNCFTGTDAPNGVFFFGNVEMDGWYHGFRPDGNSTGWTVIAPGDGQIHDCAFTAAVAHKGDRVDIGAANIGTSTLHHVVYVIGNDGGASGARSQINARSSGCAGAVVQLWSDTPQTVSGIDVTVESESDNAVLAIGDFDTSDCTFKAIGRNATDRAVQVVGNVYGCTLTAVLTNSAGRNIDVTNDSSGRPHANKYSIVSRGGGGADNTAACFFQGSDDSHYDIVALNPNNADGARWSGCNDIVFTLVHKGNGNSGTAGDGARFSSSSSGAVGTLYSTGAKFYDLDISAGCNNIKVIGRGSSHSTLASNVFVGNTCTGIDLRQFTPSLSSGGAGPIDRSRVAVLAATSGAVTVDSTKGETIVVPLSGDMTSCSVTNLAALVDSASSVISSSKLTLVIQGNAHTVVWPTAKYAGGAAPAGTGESAVTYWYDGTNLREISRAVAVA